jgi:RND family efflux transporter MFP subunit
MPNEDLSKLKIDKSNVIVKRRGIKRPLYWVAALVLILLAVFLYVKGYVRPRPAVEVATVSQMYPSQGFSLLNASGYVVAERKAAVASKITGRIVSLRAEEGAGVKEGQIIAVLEGEDAVAARDQAEANLKAAGFNLEQAKAELDDATLSFNRSKEMVGKGFIARADFDTAEARFKKAQAAVASAEATVKALSSALEGAKIALEYTNIRAPFDAVILTKNADVGDIVTPIGAAANAKAAVFTIADMNSLQVEVDISESNIEKVRVGQPCEIQLDALPDFRFRGIVHMVVPTADRTKATVTVKVHFVDKDSRILPEMSAKVAFLSRAIGPGEERPRTVLNPNSVVTRKGRTVVYVLKDDVVAETPVSLGAALGDMVEVLNGVNAGEKVVLKPLEKIRDGSRVKIAEK